MIASNIKSLRKKRCMTLDELALRIGTSKQTIHRYENGIISNIPHDKVAMLADALGVTPSELMGWDNGTSSDSGIMPLTVKRLPILGKIACGEPILAEEEYQGYVDMGSGFDADFCLRASGDSMIGARIYDGDIVFIRAQDSVDNGEIAAVIIGDEATLKRVYYYPDDGKLVLSPENPRYAPLLYTKEELNSIKIIGKAIAFQSSIT